MAKLVLATTVFPFGDPKTIGMRCAQSCTSDVVDASLAVLANQLGLTILTTDPNDMATLDTNVQTLELPRDTTSRTSVTTTARRLPAAAP